VTQTGKRRILGWIEAVVLGLSVLYLAVHTLPRAWQTLNTDFPNYYLAARLSHEGYDTSRMYEWSWIEREKDHRAVDIRVIGLLPITPFSTLAVWPLAGFQPLTAKHIWVLLNLAFLVPMAWMLRGMTGLSYRRIALAFALSVPLQRNLLFGQFYILLLLLITAGCWSYLRGYRARAGALIAIAAACKVFPLILFAFFLQRRDWRALGAGVATGIAASAVSIAAYGWNAHRTWLLQILPWTLHGEGMPPYVPTASISGILHILFLSEPQWNPHPWHNSPLAYALLLPLVQMLILAPAILLMRRTGSSPLRIMLEWSALITASLTVSTIPASYNFVLMAFPVCVLAAELLRQRSFKWVAALVIAYLSIGLPITIPHRMLGPALLLFVPRLPLMVAVLLGIYALLWSGVPRRADWTRYAWAAAMIVSTVVSVYSTLRLEQGERQEFAYRLPLPSQGFLNADPEQAGDAVQYAAFGFDGYHLTTEGGKGGPRDPVRDAGYDELSFTSGWGQRWVERTSSPQSRVVDVLDLSQPSIPDARDPVLAQDGRSLAFVRDDHGRGRLMLRSVSLSGTVSEVALTPPSLNVYEASVLSRNVYAFSATEGGGLPQIDWTDGTHAATSIGVPDSRYPALSPDGRWMAYSRLQHGVWNLWVRDQRTGENRRIADVPCNEMQPSWESDGKTLLYTTDCGRSVWFTAVAQRRVIP
jgi:Glycosyltransferase family 87/WD40-like Beta Propeller Repeat